MNIKVWLSRFCSLWLPGKGAMVLALGFAVLGSAALARDKAPVTVAFAKQGDIVERISVVGSLAAREEVMVQPLVAGREIQQILAEVGQTVEQGQPLAVFDRADAMLALDKNAVGALRARAAVAVESGKIEVALVAEREARKQLDRSLTLQPKGIIADQVLDERQNAYDRALVETALARQSLALARAEEQLIAQERREIELAISRSTVRAPESGLVLERNARVGIMTSDSGTPLFRLAKDGKIEFVAEVTETNFVRLSKGMRAKVTVPGRDEPLGGTLRLNAAQIEPKTRSGTVRIELDESEGLIPGVFARAVIDTSTRTNVFLPATAVRSTRLSHSVYVVKDDVVETRAVQTGLRQGNFVEIIEGVEDGEMVVLKAGGFLRDQDRVTPVVVSEEDSLRSEPPETAAFDRSEGTVR